MQKVVEYTFDSRQTEIIASFSKVIMVAERRLYCTEWIVHLHIHNRTMFRLLFCVKELTLPSYLHL